MAMISFAARPVLASETIAVDATAGGVALTTTKIFKRVEDNHAGGQIRANSAYISVEDQQIRVNFDPAVTVTATTNGHAFSAGDSFIVEGQALVNLRAIRTGGTSGAMRVTYFA